MKKYKTFSMQIREELLDKEPDILNEGLIFSFTYNKFKEKFNDILNKNSVYFNINVLEDGIYVEIDFYKQKTKALYDDIYSFLNVSGYYISKYKIDNNNYIKSNLNISDYFSCNKLNLILNKKFDFEDRGIKSKLYHVTDQKFQNIFNIGLVAKSNKMIDNQPDRIYLFDSITTVKSFIEEKISLNDNFVPMLLKIDVRMLNKIKLYTDPKYPLMDAVYTHDNIPAFAITELDIEKI